MFEFSKGLCHTRNVKLMHHFLFLPSSFMTPLHVAAEKAHNDVMEVLHKHGAKVNILACILFKTKGKKKFYVHYIPHKFL